MAIITKYINKSDFLLKKRFCIYHDNDCNVCLRDCDGATTTSSKNPSNPKTRPDYTDRYSVTREEYIQNLRFKNIGFRYMGKNGDNKNGYYKHKT